MVFDFVFVECICVCVSCFFLILFVYLFALFDSLFSKETEKKGVELYVWEGREDLEEDEGEVTVTRIYCRKNKLIFNKKKSINKHLKW